jgi:hypothetical protein
MNLPHEYSKNSRIQASKSGHKFSETPKVDIQRSSFDRSHGFKTTFDGGYLVPILVDEALPGDTFSVNMTAFARLATPIYPIMDNMYMTTHFFSVPYRLVWDHWKNFMGERRPNPDSSIDYTIPVMDVTQAPLSTTGYLNESLSDYMTIPTLIPGLEHNSLHHRAYNLIYNEWFRDENLQDSVTVDVDDGPDDPADYVLLRRGKRHDYFTSALPWPQKGDAVDIPMSGDANITTASVGSYVNVFNINNDEKTLKDDGVGIYPGTKEATSFPLVADLSGVAATTINQLRLAFATQRYLEQNARGGTRYIELIKSHFHVDSPDQRLQRPEYLGGGQSPVNISPVAQTSETDATPQANLSAIGTTVLNQHGFTKSFTEHCLIIGLVSVRADLTYQDGLNRMFSRQTLYDYYWPSFSNIGEQTILNKEIYAQGSADAAADAAAFGYQERYAEYRYSPSCITGKFRSNVGAGSLDPWILTQDFGALPTLGADFIVDTPPIDRVIAVPTQPHFIFDSLFKMHCARPMPVYSIPGGTHF